MARVLAVSRDAAIRVGLGDQISRAGYEVVLLSTEAEVLEASKHRDVDAVVYHVWDSDRCASTLLERLREQESDVCVIIVGPDVGAERVAMLLRGGAFDYLTYPVSQHRLEESLRAGLDIRGSFIEVRELSNRLKAVNEELASERDALRHSNQSLVLLNQLGQAMAETLEADGIVQIVKDRLHCLVPYDLLGIVWLKSERVWLHAPRLLGDQTVEQVRKTLLRQLRQNLSFKGHTFQTRPECTKILEESEASSGESVEGIDVPLVVEAGPVGILHLERKGMARFTEHEGELLKAVAVSLALALRNAEAHSHLQNLAMRDALTNLLNRRAFSYHLTREFKETERHGSPLCLIMMDLDHFKLVNDRFGHPVGDCLLKDVASLLTRTIRAIDIVTRYGGEEFAIILRRTDLSQGMNLAERIRKTIEQHVFKTNGITVMLTVSLGIACVPDPHITSPEEFVAMADQSLYRAKARGRNRLEAWVPHARGVVSFAKPKRIRAYGNMLKRR